MHKHDLPLTYRCETDYAAMPAVAPGVRNCAACKLNVHDLSGRSEPEVKAMMADARRSGRRLCVHYLVKKATGEVLLAGSLMASATAYANGSVPALPVEPEVAGQSPTDAPAESVPGPSEGTAPDSTPTDGSQGSNPNSDTVGQDPQVPATPVPEGPPEYEVYDGFLMLE
jgi:hypothetical protein